MRSPAYMPKLAEKDGSLGMNSINYLFPCIDLLLIVYPRDTREARAGRRDDGALGDEQAALRGPLRVVLRESGPRDRAGRPAPGHRRQHHPVGEAEAGRLVRREEGRARAPLVRHRRGAIRRGHGWGAEREGEGRLEKGGGEKQTSRGWREAGEEVSAVRKRITRVGRPPP